MGGEPLPWVPGSPFSLFIPDLGVYENRREWLRQAGCQQLGMTLTACSEGECRKGMDRQPGVLRHCPAGCGARQPPPPAGRDALTVRPTGHSP